MTTGCVRPRRRGGVDEGVSLDGLDGLDLDGLDGLDGAGLGVLDGAALGERDVIDRLDRLAGFAWVEGRDGVDALRP